MTFFFFFFTALNLPQCVIFIHLEQVWKAWQAEQQWQHFCRTLWPHTNAWCHSVERQFDVTLAKEKKRKEKSSSASLNPTSIIQCLWRQTENSYCQCCLWAISSDIWGCPWSASLCRSCCLCQGCIKSSAAEGCWNSQTVRGSAGSVPLETAEGWWGIKECRTPVVAFPCAKESIYFFS